MNLKLSCGLSLNEGDATFFKRVKLLVRVGYALNSFINRQILSSCKYAFMGILRNIQQSSSHDSSGNQEQNKIFSKQTNHWFSAPICCLSESASFKSMIIHIHAAQPPIIPF